MSISLPPKERHTPLLSALALGETLHRTRPSRFCAHSAEPGLAALLPQRNPHFSESLEVKPRNGGGSPVMYRPGFYANRGEAPTGEATLDQGFNSLEAVKLVKARAYAE